MRSFVSAALLLSSFLGAFATTNVSEEQSEAPGLRSLFEDPLNIEKRAPAQLITKCTVPGTAALTFDDGPYWYIYDLVRMLDAAGAKGTFFFNGNNYGCIYSADNMKRVQYAYNHGHQVASHTWAHKDLKTLTWDQIHDEMWRVEQALQRIVGVNPAFMRPPYGNYNQMVLDASGIRGQSVVIWDLDSGDTTGASVQQSINNYNNAANQRPPPSGSILALNHETKDTTVFQVMPPVIQRLKQAGYRLVTVAECVGKQPYQSVGAPQTPQPSWTC
ncbi:carbohydrate esterase family 4 protein [Panaeolus papilionaceus]|nr:carbohydrate esterase family 4 protein [Panaeolus papilionaceus]